MASWLVRSTPDRVVRVRGLARGHCVVFLGKTLNTLTVPLSTQVYKWVPANLMLGVCDGLASHPGGSRNTPSRFMLRKPEISAGLMGASLARTQTLLFFTMRARAIKIVQISFGKSSSRFLKYQKK